MDPDQTQSAAIDDTALRRFESAWTDGFPEPIEACLPSQDDECYLPTLEELVQIELEFVWKTCRTRADIARLADAYSLEQYLGRFPSLNRVESVSRLVAQEYQLRHRYGDRPSIDAYRERFPTMKLATRQLETQLQSSRSSLPTLPGYELAEVLGRGAMAVVYRARQERPRRQVALKMLLAGSSADEELVSRFKTEADAVAQLQHPNVVQIHEFIEYNGTAFLSLEFVDGGSLAEYIAGTPQPQRSSTELVLCLAEAIHAAHQQGIIHRDLKPSNILLTAEGTPKVSDFGLAKCLEADSSHTRTGEMLGTPSYMAPEQARGDIRNVDPVTDVYALGAILYELLTGRPPFRGETSWDTISQVLDQEPVSPRQLQPRIDRDLETICLKCLQKGFFRRICG